MDNSQFIALSPIERYALFLFAFLPFGYSAGTLNNAFFQKHVRKASKYAVENLLKRLAARKILTSPTWSSDPYSLRATLTPEQLSDLAASADRGSWWPSRDEIESSEKGAYDQYIVSENLVDIDCSFVELFRAFAVGGHGDDSKVLGRTMRGTYEGMLSRAVAARASNLLGERFEPALTVESWSSFAIRQLLPHWLDFAFVNGGATTRTMDFIEGRLATGVEVENSLLAVYAALAVWRAEPSRLEHPQVQANPFGKAFAMAVSGDLKSADAAFSAILKECGIVPQSSAGRQSAAKKAFGFVSVRFLVAILCIAAKPGKPPKSRPIQIFRAMQPMNNGRFTHDDDYIFAIQQLSRLFASGWGSTTLGYGEQISQWDANIAEKPLRSLLLAWDYYYLITPRGRFREKASALANAARTIAANGYLNLADMILTLLVGGYDEAEFAPVLETLRARATGFLPRCEPEPEWKRALSILEKSLDKSEKRALRESGASGDSFFWYVSFNKTREGRLELDNVYPAVRPADAPTDGSGDAIYWHDDFRESKFRGIMSKEDSLLYRALDLREESHCYGRYFSEDEEEAIARQIVGMTNLLRCDGLMPDDSKSKRKKTVPLTMREGSPTLEASVSEDGGFAVSIPAWLASARNKTWVMHDIGAGTVEVVDISKEARSVVETLSDYGTNGRLAFPREAAESAERVLSRLGELMPVTEKSATGDKSLPRVSGAASLSVRLAYADGVFKVHPVVMPIPENPNMALDPGLGSAEKLVVGAVRSFVLVRDMQAEQAELARVTSALVGFESAHDGGVRWLFNDVSEALDALVALKSAQPPLPLAWLQEKKLSVSAAPKSGVTLRSTRTAEDWFRVEGEFKLDDGRVLSVMQIVEAMANRTGKYVKLSDGDFVAITDDMRRQIAALGAAGVRRSGALEFTKAAVPMLDGVFGEGDESLELPEAMRPAADEIRAAFARSPDPPATLQAELRPYQRDGYRWLSRLAACGLGACLADDMGLGKTLETIALLLERAADGASLVLAPSSVCGNWRRELNRFAPTLNPLLPQEDPSCIAAAGSRDVVIASYGYLLFHEDDFATRKWNGVVLDEAQAIKNDASKRAKAVKRMPARFRIAATGTPVENRLGELWSLFDFLNPGLLGPASSFALRFTEDGMASPELKRLVKPLILRRLKGDVIDDLPEKTEVTLPIELGLAERTAYEACRRRALESLETADGAQASRMTILAELTRLRRFCCHPSLVLGTNDVPSAKLEALARLLDELRLGGHRALVFSQFTDFLAIVRKMVEAHGWTYRYLDGSTPTLEREGLVNAFQNGEGDFFLISLKAGGTGLNLTAADYVILLDPWWNPAVENQATDRAHRIGQRRPVTVYRLIASDTVEERVLALHKEKQAIAEDVLEGTGSAALSPAQLMALFG